MSVGDAVFKTGTVTWRISESLGLEDQTTALIFRKEEQHIGIKQLMSKT